MPSQPTPIISFPQPSLCHTGECPHLISLICEKTGDGSQYDKFSYKQLRPYTSVPPSIVSNARGHFVQAGNGEAKNYAQILSVTLLCIWAIRVPSSLEVRLLLVGVLDIDSTTLLPSQLNPFFLNLFTAHLESEVFSKGVTSYIAYIYLLDHNNYVGQNCSFT